MTEPIGGESARKAIEGLKAHLDFNKETYVQTHMPYFTEVVDYLEKQEFKEKHIVAASLSEMFTLTAQLIQSYDLYIGVLESYLSELDETFDQILEEAKKMAEQQIKEMPKERPEFYG